MDPKDRSFTGLEISIPEEKAKTRNDRRKSSVENKKKDFYAGVEHLSKYEYPEAMECFKSYLNIIIDEYGDDCDKAIFVRESIGAVAVKMENWNEAKHHYNIALNFMKLKMSSQDEVTISPHYMQILTRSTEMRLKINDFDSAGDSLEDIIEILKAGNSVTDVLNLVKSLIHVKEAKAKFQSNLDNRAECYKDGLLIIKPYLSMFNESSFHVSKETKKFLMDNYFRIGCLTGRLYIDKEKYNEAKELFQELLNQHGVELNERMIRMDDDNSDDNRSYSSTYSIKSIHERKQISNLLKQLGIIYERMKKYDAAILHYEKSLAILSKIYGKDDPKIVDDILDLGFLYFECGNESKSLYCFKEATSIINFVQSSKIKNHSRIYQARKTMLVIYIKRKDWDSASTCLQHLIKLAQRFNGNREAAIFLHQLGIIEYEQGNRTQAVKTLESSLSLKKNIAADDFFDLSITMKHLARMQSSLGMHKKAIKNYEEALITPVDQEKVSILCEMALILFRMHKSSDAFLCYQKAMCMVKKNHPIITTILINMANMYQSDGDDVNALSYYKRALALCSNLPQEPQILEARCNVCYNTGLIYLKKERYRDALSLFQEVLKTKVPAVLDGENDFNSKIASVMNIIGNVYFTQKKYTDALEWYQECMSWKEKYFGKESEYIMGTLSNLGATYYHLDDLENALKCYKRGLTLPVAVSKSAELDATSMDFASLLDSIGSVYMKKKRYDKAMRYYKRSLDMKKSISNGDEEHYEVLLTKVNIAHALCKQEKYNLAEPLLYVVYNSKLKKYGADDLEVTKLLLNLSVVHLAMSDIEQAEQFYHMALKILRTLPSDHELRRKAAWFETKMSKAKIGFHLKLEKVEEESSSMLDDSVKMEVTIEPDEYSGFVFK